MNLETLSDVVVFSAGFLTGQLVSIAISALLGPKVKR